MNPHYLFGREPKQTLADAPPCFFFLVCRNCSELEKAGRSVCRPCAVHLVGMEYPLRAPGRGFVCDNLGELRRQLETW